MALDRVPHRQPTVTVGVDTHGDVHVAAAVDELGRIMGTAKVTADQRGYRELLRFAERLGTIDRFGIEGTGAYGAGLARYLAARGHRIVEVDRPDRKTRRARGKSDPIDAEAAARATLARVARGTPKARDGQVEMIRMLRVARRSAIRGRTQAINQIHSLIGTAPEELRGRLRKLSPRELIDVLARFRPGTITSPVLAAKLALRELARRHQYLNSEVTRLDRELDALVRQAAPRLVNLLGVGTQVAGQLLVTAGDNPERLRSESSFAHLCGVAPIPASSGKTVRHRLNRGGDRHANEALYRIVLTRLSCEPRTQAYAARRVSEGLTKPELMRCLKRYVAREVYRCLLEKP
jgi:transposase